MKLVFATNNAHKLKEIRKIVTDFEIVGLADINCFDDIPETEKTLQGNAILKADYITNKFQLNCFADDTGLEIEALNNAPGVYSARYAGMDNNSEANMIKVLENLAKINQRKAQFRTVIALNLNNKKYTFEGVCKGTILRSKQGTSGFGYDPIFMPNGYNKSFAEMTMDEKSNISHRGIAMQKLIKFLKAYH